MKLPIYLDNNSTTPMDPRVFEAMKPYFMNIYGNAASRNHSFGWEAEDAVERAREQVAKIIGASSKEIIFTSGATESDNIAIKGAAEMYERKGNHIITCEIEHKAVLDPCRKLEKKGSEVTYLKPDKFGMIHPEDVEKAITDKTILVSLIMGNNEIGTINPIKKIGAVCRKHNVLLHTDATQCVGKLPIDVNDMNIDIMSISAHKMYGPKGIGALYVRRKNPRVKLVGIIDGGGHERGMRSGTLNVPGIVGLGTACEIALQDMDNDHKRISELSERFKSKIFEELGEVYLNGHPTERLLGNLNISFAYVEGEGLMMGMKDLAVSSGSACTSASLEPSYVLKALGIGDDLAHSSIRFGIGRFTTEEEVDYAADNVIKAVNHLREMSPLYEMVKDGIDLSKVHWQEHH